MFERRKLRFYPLAERTNRVLVPRDLVAVDAVPTGLTAGAATEIDRATTDIRAAREAGRPVIMAFGAHTIKNGLGPVLVRLIEHGWVTHLATNGAGVIHDWELTYRGGTSEDVRANVAAGRFGMWEETGYYLNLAINLGAYRGLGYGESVGFMVGERGVRVPSENELKREISDHVESDPERSARAADMLSICRAFSLDPGFLAVGHEYPEIGVQAAAYRLGTPFTAHPMFGHDIIYTHPMNCGAMIGRGAERDFLRFADAVADLQLGVYLSVGSAVMSPMIFEKSLSMARNLALQEGRSVDRFSIYVVDLAESSWDWQREGEPPHDHPAYYHRFCKTFSRMGGTMHYVCADNRDFLLGLLRRLETGLQAPALGSAKEVGLDPGAEGMVDRQV